MSSRHPFIVIASLIGLALLAGYAWHASRNPGGVPRSGPDAPAAVVPVAVETHAVRTLALADDVTAVGSLVSNESVVLRPEVAGRIAVIGFRDGSAVRRGDVLVELDAAVQRAELEQARAALTLAESSFHRAQDLFARKFVSQSSLDSARAQLEVARAGVALAQARLARMQIRAPFDGVVGIRSVSPGDFVKDGDALVNVEDIATLKVDFRLPEQYLDRVRAGQVLSLASDALPGERFAATVDAVDPLVDAQGRALRLRARLNNPEMRLRPGGFVRVRLILAERGEVVMVPETALVPAPGNVQFVYRVAEGKAQRVVVGTGVRREAMVEIVDGLQAGDQVVIAGQLKLRDGAPVQVRAGGSAAPAD